MFLFPKNCIHCNKANVHLCSTCHELLLKASIESICPLCIRPTKNWSTCNAHSTYPLKHVWTFGSYQHPLLNKLIKHWKQKEVRSLTREIAKLFIKSPLLDSEAKHSLLVPIPPSNAQESKRCFKPTIEVCKELSKLTSIPWRPLLTHKKKLRKQATLSKKEREINMLGAFSIIPHQKCLDRKIILIDDFITTGTSLKHAANTLKTSGYSITTGLTIARNISPQYSTHS